MDDLWTPLFPAVDAAGEFTVTPPFPETGSPRVYGGHLIATALTAACETSPGYLPHSVHALFLRPTASGEPVDGVVHTIKDGRQFSQRRVELSQNGKAVFDATVSLQAVRDDAPEPDQIASALPAHPSADEVEGHATPFLSLSTDLWFEQRGVSASPMILWVKAVDAAPRGAAAEHAIVAAMTDTGLVYAADPVAAEATADGYGMVRAVTLAHSVWFHRAPAVDEWVLLVADPVSSEGGRALARGRAWAEDGRLIASYAQEVLVHPAG